MMRSLLALVFVCSVLGNSIERAVEEDTPEQQETWDHDINFADMNGNVLPGGDLIIASENDGSGSTDGNGNNCTDSLVPAGKIAIRLAMGEFVTNWKAVALHRKGAPSTYRLINEVEGNQSFLTVMFDEIDLLFNYDLCLWKETNGLFPSKENIYRIVDAETTLKAGRIYNILWVRDTESLGEAEP